jgi:hypothetical protein
VTFFSSFTPPSLDSDFRHLFVDLLELKPNEHFHCLKVIYHGSVPHHGTIIHLFKKNPDAENPNKHFHCLKVTYHDSVPYCGIVIHLLKENLDAKIRINNFIV